MELDDLITYILLFLFFVVPSLVKRLRGKASKKAAEQPQADQKTADKSPINGRKKKPGLLGRLGTAVQDFVRELEKQALEAKKAAGEGGTSEPADKGAEGSVWDLLDDREAPAASMKAEPVSKKEITESPAQFYDPDHPFVRPEKRRVPAGPGPRKDSRPRRGKTIAATEGDRLGAPRPGVRAGIPAHALQQAVVWSEILGPPKALKPD